MLAAGAPAADAEPDGWPEETEWRLRDGFAPPIPTAFAAWDEPAWALATRKRANDAPWPFGRWETALALGAVAGGLRFLDGPDEPRWKGGVLFDDAARDALRFGSDHARDVATDGSTGLEVALWGWLVADSTFAAEPESRAELWRINLEATALNFVTTDLAKWTGGRLRPDGRDNRSFWSGHAANSATAAGLLCAHHLRGRLYGGGWPDRLACGGAATVAVGTGYLRVAADRHHLTDVLVGWAAGFVAGYVLPTRWYYERDEEQPRHTLLPMVGRDAAGLVFVMRF